MPHRKFATPKALIDYAERKGLVYLWENGRRPRAPSPAPAFTKRRQLLSPSEFSAHWTGLDLSHFRENAVPSQDDRVMISNPLRSEPPSVPAMPMRTIEGWAAWRGLDLGRSSDLAHHLT